jgi:hypothetical protein
MVAFILSGILMWIGFMLSYRSARRGRGFIAYLTGFLGVALATGAIFIAEIFFSTRNLQYGLEYAVVFGMLCALVVPAIGLYMGRKEIKNEQQRAKVEA